MNGIRFAGYGVPGEIDYPVAPCPACHGVGSRDLLDGERDETGTLVGGMRPDGFYATTTQCEHCRGEEVTPGVVTDSDENGETAFTFEPWTDGHAVGFRVTRALDGAVTYVYLNPSTDTWSDGAFSPDVFLYHGPHGNPAHDLPQTYYNVDHES